MMENGSLQCPWGDTWLAWKELQSSPEVQEWGKRAQAKTRARRRQLPQLPPRDIAVGVKFHHARSQTQILPTWMRTNRALTFLHENPKHVAPCAFTKNATLNNRWEELCRENCCTDWGAILFLETRGWHWLYAIDEPTMAVGAVVFIHVRHMNKSVKLWHIGRRRLCCTDILTRRGTIRFTSAYAPRAGYTHETLEHFYDLLHGCMAKTRKLQLGFVFADDFNIFNTHCMPVFVEIC